MRRRAATCPLLLASALLGGCGPADGVQSWAFALASPSSLSLPTKSDTDLVLDGVAIAAARGRIDGAPRTATLTAAIEGLPALGVGPDKAHFALVLLVGDGPLAPPQASLGRRLLEALRPVGTAWADGSDTEVELPAFDTSAAGRATLTADASTVRIDAVESARVDLVLPIDKVNARRFKILEGTIGNLPDAPAASTPQATGHQH